jgi:hypothetical protein
MQVQDAPPGPEQGTDPQLALQNAKQAVKDINLLSGPVGSGVSAAQNAPADLEDVYNVQDTYLQPLKIFDKVIRELADVWPHSSTVWNRTYPVPQVHPYAKIALGVLSCASKVCLFSLTFLSSAEDLSV